MRTGAVLLLWVLSLAAAAGERCIAIDGDTLICNQQKVRLTNVYAAELNETGGRAAKRRLQALIASGEITLRAVAKDPYGRTLAEVYVNGRRIEQSDIGPRAGRSSDWGSERHYLPSHRQLRGVRVRSHKSLLNSRQASPCKRDEWLSASRFVKSRQRISRITERARSKRSSVSRLARLCAWSS
jgi:hypothetical protein